MAKVLVSMPDEFLNQIDDYADMEQRTRSELIREALRNYIRKNRVVSSVANEQKAKLLEELLD
ncbi:MAG: ribbon-helix-helix domain-containing protein [Candidatus Gastranaerophilales bacterium]|nr:ribbon-helix-helix domain-containing protein [Candidatus Gastranaerophilales bacterium]